MEANVVTELMRAAGIVQEGDPRLARTARRLVLPDEREKAIAVMEALDYAADRVSGVHDFAKGLGVAAPQIGIDRAAAIVRLPGGEALSLLNPVVIEESTQTDEQFEGCLSFFDVRGLVPRPLWLKVAHQSLEGKVVISTFEYGVARLVAHELDHLVGKMYRERMRPDIKPIPVSDYRQSGRAWHYPETGVREHPREKSY
jgi:peptide deformylase